MQHVWEDYSLLTNPGYRFSANHPAAEFQTDRNADAAAIRAHIESIFQAFIDGDEKKIYDTHSEDWRGLLEGYPTPIKGIDEYMKANGIDWPKPANAPKSRSYFPAGTTYKIDDFDVHFYGPDLAVVNFLGGFNKKDGNTTVTLRRLRITDIYAKRKGSWIQVASHTAVDPDWRAEQMSQPRTITPRMREQILAAREAVWKAWFGNDRALLEKLFLKKQSPSTAARKVGPIEQLFSKARRGLRRVAEAG